MALPGLAIRVSVDVDDDFALGARRIMMTVRARQQVRYPSAERPYVFGQATDRALLRQ